MRLLMHVSLFMLLLLGCKSQEMDNAPAQMLEGSWKKVEISSGLTYDSDWTAIPDSLQVVIKFRSDGILADDKGRPRCCRPSSYIINSTLIDVGKGNDANPDCGFVFCAECPVWEMKLSSDELIISSCAPVNGKYRRL